MSFYTPESPPRGGMAGKLWAWFTAQDIRVGRLCKGSGEPPEMLIVIRAGRLQRAAGAARYEIIYNAVSFYVHEPDRTLAKGIEPVGGDSYTPGYYI